YHVTAVQTWALPILERHDILQIRRRRMRSKRHPSTKLRRRTTVQPVQDHARLMPLKVTPDRRSIILNHAPQCHGHELTPSKLRQCGVGLDYAQERHVGDTGVPNRADKHAAKRRSRLGGFKKLTVYAA